MNLPTSFPSAVAQKDALYTLSVQLKKINDQQQELFLKAQRILDAYITDRRSDVYYEFPDTIGSLRPSHIEKAGEFYPQFTAQLKDLMAQRDAIKAIPIIKPVSKKAAAQKQVEAYAQDMSGNDTLKTELLKQAPRLEAEYKKHYTEMTARFLNMTRPGKEDWVGRDRYDELANTIGTYRMLWTGQAACDLIRHRD